MIFEENRVRMIVCVGVKPNKFFIFFYITIYRDTGGSTVQYASIKIEVTHVRLQFLKFLMAIIRDRDTLDFFIIIQYYINHINTGKK